MLTVRSSVFFSSLLIAVVMLTAISAAYLFADDAPGSTQDGPERLPVQHLPNAIRLNDRILSGGLPEGEEAFAELKSLGIRTIISVDGARPDIPLAEKFGLRYVHLPHGYDGISFDRARELARAARDLPGPIYIHCHHGKHRSPAAAVVACVGNGWMAPAAARSVLEFAGTSADYAGLYRSAERARAFEKEVLDATKNEFPPVAHLPAMAEAMVELEHTFDHLKLLEASGWTTPASHPSLKTTHEALLLREHYTEMLRMPELSDRPAKFRELLTACEQQASDFRTLLKAYEAKTGKVEGRELGDERRQLSERFKLVGQSCRSCHREFRDRPAAE